MNPFAQNPAQEKIKRKLFNNAMKSNWKEVINIYTQNHEAQNAKITRSEDTALHIAIADGQEEVVEILVRIVKNDALKIGNELGNTPLHLAAYLGNVNMCKCIASRDPTLMGIRNKENETPFFLSVLHGRKDAFLCLHELSSDKGENYGYCRDKDGGTILHSAISGEYFDMAFQIIDLYPDLKHRVNEQGFSPLHILASKPSAFWSGSHIRGFEKLIYHLGHSREHRDEEYPKSQKLVDKQVPKCNIQKAGAEGQQSDDDKQVGSATSSSSYKAQGHEFFPENYFTCFHFLKFIAKAMLVILGLGSTLVVKIREKKQKHIWSVQIMEELLQHAASYDYENNGKSPGLSAPEMNREVTPYALGDAGDVDFNHGSLLAENIESDDPSKTPTPANASQTNKGEKNNGNGEKSSTGKNDPKSPAGKNGSTLEMEKKETPILIAAKNGIKELVARILDRFPVAIHDVNNEKKNIVLLAVENRQPHVYKLLLKRKTMRETIFRKSDKNGNSALHLAAMLSDRRPWLIPGAALQMQWEMKWYKFVKTSMPPHFFPRYNNNLETPRQIFSSTHLELAKEGGEWLNNTSQSCSVVAALIATVAFATSATVPGGVKEESGTPTLQDEPAFGIFAISSLVALCFSVTSVVMFLAILTSRYQEKDFGKDLPRKLLVGLTCLFVSIGSMLLSFCAGHFFVLKDKLRYTAYPMYAITCLPVTFFAVAQFPLYFDLIKATIRSVPQRNSK